MSSWAKEKKKKKNNWRAQNLVQPQPAREQWPALPSRRMKDDGALREPGFAVSVVLIQTSTQTE